jgi:hypothetical protein
MPSRAHARDLDETNRIVTSLLQPMGADQSHSVLMAATPHAVLLDHAVYRLF